ncbi:MAG: hypothetical protein AB7U05_14830 [Mangrovibacterium sp.]
METIIRIKKNKPAFKALILLAKELEKSDHSAISISEVGISKKTVEVVEPTEKADDLSACFNQLADFPALEELRKQAWPKI